MFFGGAQQKTKGPVGTEAPTKPSEAGLRDLHRVVIWLPAFQLLEAEETLSQVGLVLSGTVDEACRGHLQGRTQLRPQRGGGSPPRARSPRERLSRAWKPTAGLGPEGEVTQSLEAHRRIGVRRKRRPGPKSHGRVGVRGTGRLRMGAGLLGRGGPGDSGRSYPLRGAGAAL